jgi:hypothetical protein
MSMDPGARETAPPEPRSGFPRVGRCFDAPDLLWLLGFSFLRLNRRRSSRKKLFDWTKKGPEEIPGLRHFG